MKEAKVDEQVLRIAKLVQTSTGLFVVGISRKRTRMPCMHFEVAYIVPVRLGTTPRSEALGVLQWLSREELEIEKKSIIHDMDVCFPAAVFHLGEETSERVIAQLSEAAKAA